MTDAQSEFVSPASRYLNLCACGDLPWRPLAVEVDSTTIGFAMWAIDPSDNSFWIGGPVIAATQQGKGYGRARVEQLLDRVRDVDRPPVMPPARRTRHRGLALGSPS